MAIPLLNKDWQANHPIEMGEPREDEPCWSLKELNLLAPDGKGYRRYQIIKVLRGTNMVEWRRDLGPSDSFKTLLFNVPGGIQYGNTIEILHKVGQLLEFAHRTREVLDKEEQPQPSNLAQQWVDEEEWKRMQAKGQISFMLGGI